MSIGLDTSSSDATNNSLVLPKEIISMIYTFTRSKMNLITVFPWLKNDIPKCFTCNNSSFYMIKFKYDDACSDCGTHNNTTKYDYICSLKCKGLYYDIEYGNYVIKPCSDNGYILYANLLCEKADCYYCGRRIMYNVITTGYQIQPLPCISKNNNVSKTIQNFINEKMILDIKYKVNIGSILHNYKKFSNKTEKMTISQNKQMNKQIHKEFCKVFDTDKGYFLGCKLNPK